MSPRTGPHTFIADDGHEWRITGPSALVSGYAEVIREHDGKRSLRAVALLAPAGLSLPLQPPEDIEEGPCIAWSETTGTSHTRRSWDDPEADPVQDIRDTLEASYEAWAQSADAAGY